MKVTLLYEVDNRADFKVQLPSRLHHARAEHCKADEKAFIELDFTEKHRKMAGGYEVTAWDCPPMLNINNYGYMAFSPLFSEVSFDPAGGLQRRFNQNFSQSGHYKFSGDPSKFSDSGYNASWLGNSKYFKILTGLNIYCPVGFGLFQGPLPLPDHQDDLFKVVWAVEYGNQEGVHILNGGKHFKVQLNFVCEALTSDQVITIRKGQPIGVFYPVLKQGQFSIEALRNPL